MEKRPSEVEPGALHWHNCCSCNSLIECTERHSAMEQNWVCEYCLLDVGLVG